MKKTYKAPIVTCVKLNVESVIAGSLDSLNVNGGGGSVSKDDVWTKDEGAWGDIWSE
ncbi:MAG: hypothetical protein IJ767_07615 [Bacteroidaceae bacterium]|nr:hypothetical protein [Bacteroidaceae bacterium]